jgi:L-malate glycosyltransferase
VKQTLKIILLSDTYSEHTEKWALGLADKGIEVGLFSFNKASYPWYAKHKNITLLYEPEAKINSNSINTKIAYLFHIKYLRKVIATFKPDILHAHYATSYGLIGALAGFKPFVVSAWGTDVMKFPFKSKLHTWLMQFIFNKTQAICATSFTIKNYIEKIGHYKVNVIPFGIDTNKFTPIKGANTTITIGTTKPLEPIYNIDKVIMALEELVHVNKKDIHLNIIGEGTELEAYKLLVVEKKLMDNVHFLGRIPFNEIHLAVQKMDILINVSEYESFGVSVIEAMACGKPVIVNNVGGLAEIIHHDTLGIKININEPSELKLAILKLIDETPFKHTIEIEAHKEAISKYDFSHNLEQQISLYKQLV